MLTEVPHRYLLFASVFITVKSVMKQVDQGGFSFRMLFTDDLFFTLIVSMCSTWLLYLFASILFLDPWHMVTCFLQYLLLTPTYINIMNVYASCNTHDTTWGTKGDDTPEALSTAILKPEGRVELTIPADDADLNAQYDAELRAFQTKWDAPKCRILVQEKHEDYYKGFRSAIVLAWMFCNLALAAVALSASSIDRVDIGSSVNRGASQTGKQRTTIYLMVVLYNVAALSGIRFMGACWYMVVRLSKDV
jgi:chitin synthase